MNSRTTLIVVTATISAAVTSALWMAVIALAYIFMLGNPPPFAVKLDAPQEAVLGETVQLKIQVSNPSDEPLEVGSVDVYDSLLDGFSIVQLDPEPEERDHVLDFSTFFYSKPLGPGESFQIVVSLKAARTGVWTGDVDVCTPFQKFVTTSLTIRVNADRSGEVDRRETSETGQ